MKDQNAVESLLAVQLPGTITPSEAPDEIMWMPPGRHTINASRGGKPVQMEVVVDERGAQNVAASYAEYTAAADRGEGDRVYFDFNHDDREASAHPTEFFWAGDDPQRGGIRAKVQWTGSGRQAVIGRTYSRFSPSFYASENGAITGTPVCAGALVNRAAFQRIAPILSKQAEAAIVSGSADFMTKANAIAKARRLDLGDACVVLASEQPDAYDRYRSDLLGVKLPARAKQQARTNENDELMVRARALADALDIGLGDAATKIAHEQPALYERYRARLFDLDLDRTAVAAVHARAEKSSFFVRCQEIAQARGIDITAAFDVAAREAPELYDAYRASL